MAPDPGTTTVIAVLAVWLTLSSFDDLLFDLACLVRWLSDALTGFRRVTRPGEAELDASPRRRIAIFVPLWREHQVIRKMIEHNIAAIRYDSYDFFIGAYPNDEPTLDAVRDLESRFSRVHLAVCPHDGPTSKADCLNWIYQRMLLFEQNQRARFDTVVIHDAEDLIHPEALRQINYFGQRFDMVQVPVLPLPTALAAITHGVYCDEFAEFQLKELPTRCALGGFLPSCGVGTAFSRQILEKLAATRSNRIFEPQCLTEDYEIGFRIHRLQGSQIFVPVRKVAGGVLATREYFPRRFRAAVRQRTRWLMGIALQSWELHGWDETFSQLYWFWRDRKGLVGHLLNPLANFLFVRVILATGRLPRADWLAWSCLLALGLQLVHLAVKMACSGMVYGFPFALGVPVRMMAGNAINLLATISALRRYLAAKWKRAPLLWLKTEHAYPNRNALASQKRRLGEILVGSQYITTAILRAALASQPPGLRLGEHLVRLGHITEDDLYEALSLQQDLPTATLTPRVVCRQATRSLPVALSRKWKVIPYQIESGQLFVAGPEPPTEAMTDELGRFSSLTIRYQLITPSSFVALKSEFLPKNS